MAKLNILATLLATLLMVSSVSAFRTTITTTVVEEEGNPGRQAGSCQEQVRQQDNFNMCHMFLSEHAKGGSFYDELAMVTGRENPQKGGQHLKQCCKQMENVSEECRCEGLKMMMSQHQEKQQQMQEMRRGAENLPQMCNLSPKTCQFETTVLF